MTLNLRCPAGTDRKLRSGGWAGSRATRLRLAASGGFELRERLGPGAAFSVDRGVRACGNRVLP